MLLCNIVFAPLSSAPGAKKTQEKIGGGGGGGGGAYREPSLAMTIMFVSAAGSQSCYTLVIYRFESITKNQ